MQSIKPRDLVAISVIVMIVLLKLNGIDEGFQEVLAGIIGYYFGHRHSGIDKGS
jgi:hypothetical protein